MKLHDIDPILAESTLEESITFTSMKLDQEKRAFTQPFASQAQQECWYCDGTGKEPHSSIEYDCSRCDGKGSTVEWVSNAPELTVSNANAYDVLQMLDIKDPDYVGSISPKELPTVMRKLLRLKNSGFDQYTEPSSVDRPAMQRRRDPQTGLDTIGRQGPTVHHMGRSHAQVQRYIDQLISIIQFAQKHDLYLTWG
jgi:hypothetical protein